MQASRSRRWHLAVPALLAVGAGAAPPSAALASATHTPLPATPEPTTLTVSLDTEGQSGPDLTVPDGARVTANSTLSGPDASTAHGPASVSYKVFSDSACTNEVAAAGSRRVNQGIDSRPVRLTPGTYYWQASYVGDAGNQPSVSACGAAIETVEGTPLPSSCSGISGLARFDREEGPVVLHESLSTNLGERQRLYGWWPGAHRLVLTRLLGAWCLAGPKRDYFRGVGEAKLDGGAGYMVRFWISVGEYGETSLRLRVRDSSRELVLATGGPLLGGGQSLH